MFLDKREALAKACVVAKFNVSEGSLPPIETKASGDRLLTSLRLPVRSIDETTTFKENERTAYFVKHHLNFVYLCGYLKNSQLYFVYLHG
ncbi:hypothetical protein EZS27_019672 [termite gut metagenome]|uniref:Uncharacterized protein n=1 Tax=termite gut metagenome TaxID=433724 RepID=A0A5J4RFR5_9ZZZZ